MVLQPLKDRLTPQQVQAVAAKMIADLKSERMRSLRNMTALMEYDWPFQGKYFSTTRILRNSNESYCVQYSSN